MSLSVAIITFNEEHNLRRTLESVRAIADEIVVVDSGSTDRTVEIAHECGAKVFVEPWKGYAAQKNSALEKCTGDWILSLDADEIVSEELAAEIHAIVKAQPSARECCLTTTSRDTSNESVRRGLTASPEGFYIARRNFFLGRWIKHGGFWPDAKLRLFRRGAARFENRLVHEDAKVSGAIGKLEGALLHYAYPTLEGYIAQMNRYSSLGAQMVAANGEHRFSVLKIVVRPAATFLYNYFSRLGFMDGREGLLLHLYHAVYVSWKYAKAWELARRK